MKKKILNIKNKKTIDAGLKGFVVFESAAGTANQQFSRYTKMTGHGFAAEDANALNDALHFRHVDKVGTSNAKNGADRIVNLIQIQTKYCQTANQTVNAAFDDKTGLFRYNNMLLEVPKDQYNEAVNLMKDKIKGGQVPGFSDPNKAVQIIKQGDVTYQQAKNIAKPGNIDSLIFDVKSQAVVALYAGGISFVISYVMASRSGKDRKECLQIALSSALKIGTLSIIAGVATQQLLRTTLGRSCAAFYTHLGRDLVRNIYATEMGKHFVHGYASHSLHQPLTNAAARNSCARMMSSNFLTGSVMLVAISTPDFYRAMVNKSISWNQFSKNLIVSGSGVAGGVSGGAIGFSLGGPIGGAIGGLTGGISSSLIARKLSNFLIKDDAEKMFQLVKTQLGIMAEDYLVSEAEFTTSILPAIHKIVTAKWLRKLYQVGKKSSDDKEARANFINIAFQPYFEKINNSRKPVNVPHVQIRYKSWWVQLKSNVLAMIEKFHKRIAWAK